MKIGILGAGIVGVNTALQVQNEFPNAQISVIAEGFGNETLSSGAAGIFRPGTSFSAGNDEVTQKWITDSYDFYNQILHSESAFEAGIMQVSGYIFSSKSPSITKNHFLEKLLPIYRPAGDDELEICPSPEGSSAWKYGAYFQTMVIESSSFLPWGLKVFESRGGETKQRRVEAFTDLLGDGYDYVINCTGFGSKWLCNDRKLVPIRGQVYKVKAPWVKMFYYGDYDTYIIPGSTTVTLGGCRQFDSYKTEVDRYDSASIWDRCTSLLPSLKRAELVREWVGLRPYRDPVNSFNMGTCGYGVTTSPGSAIHATKALKELIRSGKVDNSGSTTAIMIVSKL
ncbi:D-aspartate oxidase [Orchesella cincta]|uniref:D-aspartate oxidase n=1 Tax=Orchesella cincta TaxID=48709 RepID=A0A1D2M547_ORCCI|nr:D-aspartate oxidase [Orchesella cincta]